MKMSKASAHMRTNELSLGMCRRSSTRRGHSATSPVTDSRGLEPQEAPQLPPKVSWVQAQPPMCT